MSVRTAPPFGNAVSRWVPALVPIALLLGTNVKVIGGARPIYVGASELVVLLGGSMALLVLWLGRDRIELPPAAAAVLVAYSLTLPASNLINVVGGAWTDWPLGSLLEIVRWFEYVALVPILVVLVRDRRQLHIMLGIALVALAINAGVALYQAATFNFAEMRTFALFRSASDAEGLSESNPNSAGTLFMYWALLALAWASAARRASQRLLLLLVAAAGMLAMLFTLSRSSTLGFAVGAVMLPFTLGFNLRARLWSLAALGVFLTAAGVAISFAESLATRLLNTLDLSGTSSDAASVLDRFENWRITLEAWPRYVLTGLGYGRFGQYFPFITPDNLFLELLATVGIPGLALFLLLFGRLTYDTYTIRSAEPIVGVVRATFLSVLAGTAVTAMTGAVMLSPRVCGSFFLLAGAMYVVRTWSRPVNG